jgi:ATP-dependent Clp protease adaptor protein ClpS
MSNESDHGQNRYGVLVRVKANAPKMYKVLLYNDDFTPMDFVVEILQTVFGKDEQQATKIMLDVHHKGFGVCGVYPRDIAETKTSQVSEAAVEREYPLKCSFEEA